MNHTPLLLLDAHTVARVEGERLVFAERVIPALARLRAEGPFAFVLIEAEDDGTLVETLRSQGIDFDDVLQDLSLDGFSGERFDLASSVLVTGDENLASRAGKLGCQVAFWGTKEQVLFAGTDWNDLVCFLLGDGRHASRKACVTRNTKETQIQLAVNLDGTGCGRLQTGIGFFDHMLEQVVRHANLDVDLKAHGDLEVDEHHCVEDVAIVLGSAILEALGDKRGISRYGCELLPMDDVQAKVVLDFSSRPAFLWDCPFSRQYVGTFPTEMVEHFFKSFSDSARCNLHMQVTGGNTHHQVEALFKAFAHALRQAVRRYYWTDGLPSTKGSL